MTDVKVVYHDKRHAKYADPEKPVLMANEITDFIIILHTRKNI